MSLFSGIFERKSSSFDLFNELAGGQKSASGKKVTVKNAIDISTVFACCRVIGQGLAQVPLKLRQKSPDGRSRVEATFHPLYDKLANKPNRWQTSHEYREMIGWHLMLTGNHYSFINRLGGKIVELYPFEPSSVTSEFKNGVLTYEVAFDGGDKKKFPQEAIWHIRGPSMNGWQGLDVVKHAREAIGIAMATEESVGSLHKNGIMSSGVYSVDGTLNENQYKVLSKWINDHNAGSANAGNALILDRAAKWQSTQMTSIDAQSLENRKFQIEEICRFAGILPIMVGYSDKATTYASAEQQYLQHLRHTLAPLYDKLEDSINGNLLTEEERNAGFYADFVEEGLLRGSAIETKDVILGYVNGGILTPNEGRALLDLNPDPDPDSDKLRIPANIVGQDQINSQNSQEESA
jgi:HK97 family phage portal protein